MEDKKNKDAWGKKTQKWWEIVKNPTNRKEKMDSNSIRTNSLVQEIYIFLSKLEAHLLVRLGFHMFPSR